MNPRTARPILALLVALVVAGCAIEAGPPPSPAAEAEVWAAAIEGMQIPGDVLVVRGRTDCAIAPREPGEAVSEHDAFPAALVARLRSLPEAAVTADLRLPRRVEIVSPEALDALAAGPGGSDAFWRGFSARYPHSRGFVTLSRVAFSASGGAALLTLDHTYASLGGKCWLLLLERTGDGWRIRDKELFRVS